MPRGRPRFLARFEHDAPAPSPNSTQVVRSSQSRMRLKVSAPITKARLRHSGAEHRIGDAQRVEESPSTPPRHRKRCRHCSQAHPARWSHWRERSGPGVAVASTIRSIDGLRTRQRQCALRAASVASVDWWSRPRRQCSGCGCRCAQRSIRRWYRPARQLVALENARAAGPNRCRSVRNAHQPAFCGLRPGAASSAVRPRPRGRGRR
jgi:hypothetical protein